MKIIQAQMGFAPKHIGFLGLAGIKIEEKSMKNRSNKKKSDPGFKANFLRFGVDFWVSLRAKMMKNLRKIEKAIEF